MGWRLLGAGCLLAAAAFTAVSGRRWPRIRVRRRLAVLAVGARPRRRSWRPRNLPAAGAGAAGLAVAVVVGGWVGVLVGCVAAVGAHRLLRRLEPASARAERTRIEADLPLAADLLAAGLRSGAPVDNAASAVAQALGGPLGERLGRVSRALRLGADPAEGWTHLGSTPGAERMSRAAVRSSASGAALAGALTRLADDLRADRGVAAEAAARRAGVLIVLPLGLCFLPAFLLAGLVPVIVAVLGDVL
jgi:pilus assembly protein TadC